ncbi:GerAB/ArcD/ProY family transporter [Bacillus sp. EB600]|uniref:GerAB/ArcD/ProY family transporter n=1 Tax=Bacillus sp. EB600 TaxID=2806345 RepID=UPI00210888F8|nr:GerAB/ArcD/ProY family transporter [Bacillus sp. EB600]MCQ6279877.1 GerAB/ArcD/ProY family transporter [Bacillus sp. EB600]
MLKENISLSQLLTLSINFLLGSTIVLGIGTEAKNDAWIAIGVASFLGAGLIWFYHKLQGTRGCVFSVSFLGDEEKTGLFTNSGGDKGI